MGARRLRRLRRSDMAERRRGRSADRGDAQSQAPVDDGQPGVLITFRPERLDAAVDELRDAAGISRVALARDYDSGAVDLAQAADSDMIVFNELGIAVASVEPDQVASMMRAVADDTGIAH